MKLYENKMRVFIYLSFFCGLYFLLVLLFYSEVPIYSRYEFFDNKIVLGWVLILLLVFLIVGSYNALSWEDHVYFMCDEKKFFLSWQYAWQLKYFHRDEIECIEIQWEDILITFLEERNDYYRYISSTENRRKTWNNESSVSDGYNDAVINNHPKNIFIKGKHIRWNPNINDIFLAISSFFEYSRSWK